MSRTDGKPLSGGPCETSAYKKELAANFQVFENYAQMSDSVCLQNNIVYKIEMEMPDSALGGTFLIDSVSRYFICLFCSLSVVLLC